MEAEDEKSLMSDFNDGEIEALVPPNAVEVDLGTGGLKRPRSPSPQRPSRTLLLDVDEEEEAKGETSSDDELAPKKKKRRLKRKAEQKLGQEEEKKEDPSTLLDKLFEDDPDLFESDGEKEEEKKPKKILAFPEDEKKAEEVEIPEWKETPETEGPTIPVDDERILPGIGGSAEMVEVHCVFADDPNMSGWTILTSTETAVDNCLQKMPWGVFMRRAHDPSGTKSNWFIVLAPDRTMRCIASPFFFSTIGLVRVDPKSVTLQDDTMGLPAIYYAYHLTSKVPIWKGTWTLPNLVTIAVDTLYAHVEDSCRRRKSTRDAADIVKQALRAVSSFPISHKDPVNSPLPGPQVPLTASSPRKNRKETLKELWEKPLAAKAPLIQQGTVDTSGFVQCQQIFASNVNYFFADLEKPPRTWAVLADRGQFDCVTLCEVTHWARSTVFSVCSAMKQIAEGLGISPLSLSTDDGEDGASGAHPLISEERFLQVATLTPLNLDWFSAWFSAYFDKGSREDRLRYYAIFAASEILHDHYEMARTFGPISAGFIFTKWRRERLFDSGAHARSPHHLHHLALENVKVPESSAEITDVLKDEERVDVREDIARFLQKFAEGGPELWDKHQLALPPRALVLRDARVDGKVIVDKEVDEVGRRLASLVIQMALRWKRLVPKESPLRRLPPVVAECASVYGANLDDGLEEFYQSIANLVVGKPTYKSVPEILILRSSALGEQLEAALRDAKRQAGKKSVVRVLVLDSFHLWPIAQLTTMLTAFKETPDILGASTHLIITGRMNSLSETAGGGNFVWDLLDVAARLNTRLGLDKDVMSVSSVPMIDRFSRTQGTLSVQLYGSELREEQYKFNQARVRAHGMGESIGLLCIANRQRGTERPPTVLVLTALKRTQIAFKRMWIMTDDTMVVGPRNSVTFTTYQAFARAPSALALAYSYVLFADVHYAGKGRLAYHHINAAFERATVGIHVIAEKGESPATALEAFYDRFLHNDARTDSLNMHVGRCNLLINVFDKLMETGPIKKGFSD